MDEAFADEPDHEDEPDEAESQDDHFTAKDAFILGGAMEFAYEEGVESGCRKNNPNNESKKKLATILIRS